MKRISFYFGNNDEDYYNRYYIKKCRDTQNITGQLEDININVNNKKYLKNTFLRTFYNNTHGLTNCFATDVIRLIEINNYDDCFYCDTDVYFTDTFKNDIRECISKYDVFVVNHTTGTFLYNKHKNNPKIKKFINFYNSLLIGNDNVFKYTDTMAYDLFNEKYPNLIETVNTDKIIHFGDLYCFRNSLDVYIILEPISNTYNITTLKYNKDCFNLILNALKYKQLDWTTETRNFFILKNEQELKDLIKKGFDYKRTILIYPHNEMDLIKTVDGSPSYKIVCG